MMRTIICLILLVVSISHSWSQEIEPKMMLVQGGAFQMGHGQSTSGESYKHDVTLTDFYISQTEVTQRQWEVIMNSNPSFHTGCNNCPVEMVNYADVMDYIEKLNQMSGKNYRLPTEAEWEYAAGGGITREKHVFNYSGNDTPSVVGWFSTADAKDNNTHPVGMKAPNLLGIYDLSGNVWEWCQDWYDPEFFLDKKAPKKDPEGPDEGEERVVRGGSFSSYPSLGYIYSRSSQKPTYKSKYLGFRLVLQSPSPMEQSPKDK